MRYLIILFFLVGCTTVRPPSLQEVKKTDTVRLQPTIINNKETTKTIEAETVIFHDTVRIYKETVLPGVAYMDTVALGIYLDKYYDQTLELEELKKMLLSVQHSLNRKVIDSQKNIVLQKSYDTTKKANENLKAITEAVTYKIPTYFYLVLLGLVVISYSYYRFLKWKLAKKELEKYVNDNA